MKIVVIGGGIAGLCVALRLRSRHDVVVLERDSVPGGKIRSQKIDGFLFDWGPNGFLSSAASLRELVREVGVESSLVQASPAASRRFIYWNGKLHALPSKPTGALTMSLLTVPGKLRALREFFVPPARDADALDEDVYSFFTRRFGREVAERIVAPALLGMSAGDAKATSAGAMFPRLGEMEREHGSLLRSVMRARAKPGRLTGFGPDGMQVLTDALVRTLGDRVWADCGVERISPRNGGWRVGYRGGELEADAVVLATPSETAAAIVHGYDATLARLLRSITYAPMRVVGIALHAREVPVPLDGFGFLVARHQGIRILGALYTSTTYPDQAPAGTAYLRVFLGGAADRDAAALDARRARTVVRKDLAAILGITAEPLAYHEVRWPRAIPQYAPGHRALVARIDERLRLHESITVVGNAYRGIGLNDTVRDAFAVAESIC